MKKAFFILLAVLTVSTNAQFKDPVFETEKPKDGIFDNSSNSILGFINPDNFSMRHSVNLSYSTFGSYGTSLATYTNSMMYKFSDRMNVQLDASFVTSPYSSFGKEFQNSIQGIYISRAAFNYRPWDDFSISFQYRSLPNYYFDPYSRFGGFYGEYYHNSIFGTPYGSFIY